MINQIIEPGGLLDGMFTRPQINGKRLAGYLVAGLPTGGIGALALNRHFVGQDREKIIDDTLKADFQRIKNGDTSQENIDRYALVDHFLLGSRPFNDYHPAHKGDMIKNFLNKSRHLNQSGATIEQAQSQINAKDLRAKGNYDEPLFEGRIGNIQEVNVPWHTYDWSYH